MCTLLAPLDNRNSPLFFSISRCQRERQTHTDAHTRPSGATAADIHVTLPGGPLAPQNPVYRTFLRFFFFASRTNRLPRLRREHQRLETTRTSVCHVFLDYFFRRRRQGRLALTVAFPSAILIISEGASVCSRNFFLSGSLLPRAATIA